MKNVWLALALAALCGPVAAATPQQDRMKSCNAQAKKNNLAGEERKKFMSQCLSATAPAAPAPAAQGAATASGEKKLTPQQAKMKTCNADATAKNLKGEPRKKFMSQCLKA